MGDNDQHVMPASQEHVAGPGCWCRPIVEYEDPVTRGKVWLHRRALDTPYRETDDGIGHDDGS